MLIGGCPGRHGHGSSGAMAAGDVLVGNRYRGLGRRCGGSRGQSGGYGAILGFVVFLAGGPTSKEREGGRFGPLVQAVPRFGHGDFFCGRESFATRNPANRNRRTKDKENKLEGEASASDRKIRLEIGFGKREGYRGASMLQQTSRSVCRPPSMTLFNSGAKLNSKVERAALKTDCDSPPNSCPANPNPGHFTINRLITSLAPEWESIKGAEAASRPRLLGTGLKRGEGG